MTLEQFLSWRLADGEQPTAAADDSSGELAKNEKFDLALGRLIGEGELVELIKQFYQPQGWKVLLVCGEGGLFFHRSYQGVNQQLVVSCTDRTAYRAVTGRMFTIEVQPHLWLDASEPAPG